MTKQQHDALIKCIRDALNGFQKANNVTISINEMMLLGFPPGPNGPGFQYKLVTRFNMKDNPDLSNKPFNRRRKAIEN